jgi:hypothetical protein
MVSSAERAEAAARRPVPNQRTHLGPPPRHREVSEAAHSTHRSTRAAVGLLSIQRRDLERDGGTRQSDLEPPLPETLAGTPIAVYVRIVMAVQRGETTVED